MCSRDMLFPKFLICRSVLKLLYISFSVLHTWLQSVEILSVCTGVRGRSLPDTSCITSSLFQSPLCVRLSSCPFPVTVCGACDPSPEHAQPQGFDSMAVTTSEPFACVLVLHPAPGRRGLTLPVVLFTAARKENCLPLKMYPVKKWRSVQRRPRQSLWPPGPPAAVQSRGNARAPLWPWLSSSGHWEGSWHLRGRGPFTIILTHSRAYSAPQHCLIPDGVGYLCQKIRNKFLPLPQKPKTNQFLEIQ